MMPSLKRGSVTTEHAYLRQGVDSLAQWLEHWIFNREDGFDSRERREIFSAMLYSFVITIMS